MAQILQAVFHQGPQRRVDHTPSGALVVGEVINLGSNLVAVVTSPEGIAASELGAVDVDGIYLLRKNQVDAFAAGAKVSWDDTANEAEVDGGVNEDFKVGIAVEAAVAADLFVKTWIGRTNPHA